MKKQYGITLDEYATLLASQGGACAICRRQETGKRLAVDHDHTTGVVRGLLCQKCNTALGLLGDDIHLIDAAWTYLCTRALATEAA